MATAARLLLAAVLLLALAANHNASATFDEDKLEVINEIVAEVKAVKLAILCAKAKKFWINLDICNNTKPNITCEQCGPGFQLINGQCAPCGMGFACPDGCNRTACGVFESTPNDTSAECLPLTCDVCPDTNPTVFFSTRQAPFADPPGALWRIRDYAAGVTNLQPELLCQINLDGAIGVNDIAFAANGDLLVIGGPSLTTLGYVPKADIPTVPAAGTPLPVCTAVALATIPEVAGNTAALGVGKKSNIVYIGGSSGNVQAVTFNTGPDGNLTYQVQPPVNLPCKPGSTRQGSSVDVIVGPNSDLYRWCGANAAVDVPYSGSRFALGADNSIQGPGSYVSVGLNNAQSSNFTGTDFVAGGTFCSRDGTIGLALDSIRAGNSGMIDFYLYGPNGSAADQAQLTASTVASGANSTKWLVSGATNAIACSM